MQFIRFWRVEVPARSESVDESVVADFSELPTVVSIQIVVVHSGSTEVHIAMTLQRRARARGDVQNATKAVAIFGRETPSHQINSFENLWAHARAKLRLRIIEERYAVDEFMQRKLISTHIDEVVMALAGTRHQVGDQAVGAFHHGIRKLLQILLGEGLRTARFFRIDTLVSRFHLDGLLDRLRGLQFYRN